MGHGSGELTERFKITFGIRFIRLTRIVARPGYHDELCNEFCRSWSNTKWTFI